MITIDIKETTKPQYEIIASNGKEINDIIQEICDECHQGLTYSSITTSEAKAYEDKEKQIDALYDAIDILECKLCHILNLLGD